MEEGERLIYGGIRAAVDMAQKVPSPDVPHSRTRKVGHNQGRDTGVSEGVLRS